MVATIPVLACGILYVPSCSVPCIFWLGSSAQENRFLVLLAAPRHCPFGLCSIEPYPPDSTALRTRTRDTYTS